MTTSLTKPLRCGIAAVALAGGLVALCAPATAAQTVYRCSQGSSVTISDRPCAPGTASSSATYGGGAPVAAPRSVPDEATLAEQQQQQSQKAACAQLNETLRSASTSASDFSMLSGLLGDYQNRCRELDQAAARARTQDDGAAASVEKVQKAAQARLELLREQCTELNSILAERRKRAGAMDAGGRADLERSEANYNARCKTR